MEHAKALQKATHAGRLPVQTMSFAPPILSSSSFTLHEASSRNTCAPSLCASSFLSGVVDSATTLNPDLAANWTARCPRPAKGFLESAEYDGQRSRIWSSLVQAQSLLAPRFASVPETVANVVRDATKSDY